MADLGKMDTGFSISEHNTTGTKIAMPLRWMLTDWMRYRNPGSDEYVNGLVDNLLKTLERQNV